MSADTWRLLQLATAIDSTLCGRSPSGAHTARALYPKGKAPTYHLCTGCVWRGVFLCARAEVCSKYLSPYLEYGHGCCWLAGCVTFGYPGWPQRTQDGQIDFDF